MPDLRSLLARVADHVSTYREAALDAPVFPDIDRDAVRSALGPSLPDGPASPDDVVTQLVAAVEPALVASTGARYFGFVIGGALDAATAADVLAVGWDQNAVNELSSPAAAVVEEVAGAWLLEVLHLPRTASFGFVTGAQGANTVCLAAARHKVLSDVGWDVEQQGLARSPEVRVVANEERHVTIDRALRLLGFGTAAVEPVATDANGAIDVASLRAVLARRRPSPTIVCLQAGNVNTGASDPLGPAVDAAHEHGAWAHVDGAFGLWAAACPSTRAQVEGVERADSWAADGHKWLNVPYDAGYAFCAHPGAHTAAMAYSAAYLTGGPRALRSPGDYVAEASRRARGMATWAALRQLGRRGVAELVERCCGLARRFADDLDAVDGIAVVNDVVLNQVLVRFGDDDETTDRVIAAVQRSGECWMGPTTWRGRRLMRISVSNWRTGEEDVDRSVRAIVGALRA